MIQGVGFSLHELSIAGKVNMTISTMIGVAFGGWVYMRWGMFRSLLVFGIGQALTNLLYMWLALAGKKLWLLVLATIPGYHGRRHGSGGVRRLPGVAVFGGFQRHSIRAAVRPRDFAAQRDGRDCRASSPGDRMGEFLRGHLPDCGAGADFAGGVAQAPE